MGYPTDVVEKGRKLVAEGKALEDVRAALGKHVSQKAYDKWAEQAQKSRPKVAEINLMLCQYFTRLDGIAAEKERLDAEETEIRGILQTFNITERPKAEAV